MAEQRLRILTPTTGAVTFDTRFASKAAITLTGNVTLTLAGMTTDGKVISIWVKQDATGSRTFTISPITGTSNIVIGPGTGVIATANATTKVEIARVNGVYNVIFGGATT